MIGHLISGFSLGLSTGPFCLTACLPVLLSATLAQPTESRASGSWAFFAKFIAGRFLAYTALGLLAGMLGASMGAASHRIAAWAWVILALMLILYGLGAKLPKLGLCEAVFAKTGKSIFPFALGVLTGVNVCPPILLVFTYVVETSVDLVTGVMVFISFFLATVLFMVPIGFAGYLRRHAVTGLVGRAAAIVTGMVFLYQGVSLLKAGGLF